MQKYFITHKTVNISKDVSTFPRVMDRLNLYQHFCLLWMGIGTIYSIQIIRATYSSPIYEEKVVIFLPNSKEFKKLSTKAHFVQMNE